VAQEVVGSIPGSAELSVEASLSKTPPNCSQPSGCCLAWLTPALVCEWVMVRQCKAPFSKLDLSVHSILYILEYRVTEPTIDKQVVLPFTVKWKQAYLCSNVDAPTVGV